MCLKALGSGLFGHFGQQVVFGSSRAALIYAATALPLLKLGLLELTPSRLEFELAAYAEALCTTVDVDTLIFVFLD